MARLIRNGRLTITRVDSNRGPSVMQITVEDETSGVEFVRVRVGMKEFAQALTSMMQECEFELSGVRNVGQTRETKTERVTVTGYAPDKAQVRAAVKEHEVDGWRGRDSDVGNNHRIAPGGVCDGVRAYMVHYSRFVYASGKPVMGDEVGD